MCQEVCSCRRQALEAQRASRLLEESYEATGNDSREVFAALRRLDEKKLRMCQVYNID